MAEPPRRGDAIGRFLVLDELGAGGSGVVVRAYDPELDRRVAIKLLHADRGDGGGGEARIVREAQAMARLAHPNVVPVYEVGTDLGRVFLVLELVDGQTLTAWLAAAPRSWRAIVATFADAGRGLAAAHAAGLVHRDFKPDNVLVGVDGRARVTDFGLVGRGDATPIDDAAPIDGGLGASLTATGALIGTPRYMAPEQHRREPATARSDQFALCVALWTALYGAPPFPGDGYRALAVAVLDGALAEPPRDAAVPPYLRRVLTRGLAADPAARFADVGALLAALADDPAAVRRQRLWIGGGVAVTAGLGLAVALAWPTRAPSVDPAAALCSGAEAQLAGAWDPTVRARLAAAFGSGARGAAAWSRVASALDAYAAAWATRRTDACAATRRRGEQSEELLDLRMTCFDRRRAELAAVVTAVETIAATQPDPSVQAVAKLTPLDRCDDVAALTAPVRPPTDAAARAQVAALTTRLAAVKAQTDTGQYAAAVTAGTALRPEVEATGYLPLVAETLQQLAEASAQAGDPAAARAALADATWAAEASHHDAAAARAWVTLVFVAGFLGGDREAGEAAVRRADAAVLRIGDPGELRGRLELNRGALSYGQGDVAGALARWEHARTLWTAALGARHADLARVYNNLASGYGDLGRHDEAVAAYREALAIWEAALGPSHPLVATTLQNLALEQLTVGDLPAAAVTGARALAIHEEVLGATHPQVARTLRTVAGIAVHQGRLTDADAALTRALAIEDEHGGATASLLYELADLRRAQRQTRDARVLVGRALAMLRDGDLTGATRGDEGVALGVLAELELDDRAWSTAERLATDAVAAIEERYGATAPRLAHPLEVLGRARLGRGDAAGAATALERALGLLDRGPGARRAQVQLALAEARWRLEDRAAARALADAAGVELAKLVAPGDLAAELAAWRAEHP